MSKKSAKSGTTPLMEQYLSIKKRYSDVILLYRMGDFYETFYEDAQLISKVLGITLTKRAHGKSADVPLAGFPYHALDNYLPKLVDAGHRVAICEQVEDPKQAKTIVKRDVVEIVTPGTAISDKLLDHKSSNYIACVTLDKQNAGLAYADFSTGAFYLTETSLEKLVHLLQEIDPREILLSDKLFDQLNPSLVKSTAAIVTKMDSWLFSHQFGHELLTRHFKTPNLKGFGAEAFELGVIAAGAILHYGKENFQNELGHITRLSVVASDDQMILDPATRRNLELLSSISGQKEGTLLSILDRTETSMGGRLFREIITHPLINAEKIQWRLDRVQALYESPELCNALREQLAAIADLERLYARVATGRATPRELGSLRRALAALEPVAQLLQQEIPQPLHYFRDNMSDVGELTALLEQSLTDEPPNSLSDGGIIAEGYDQELDELRTISREGKNWILQLQEKERESSGITTLKIGYNRVFGYYFEVTKAQQNRVPDYFIRKQTLVNAERYITPDLKEIEDKVLGAEEKIAALEYRLFQDLRQQVTQWGDNIQNNARLIALLDCFAALAYVAHKYQYVRPEIGKGDSITITGGRHPVVERLLPPDESFIENDASLSNSQDQILVITGPNMSGKSTYLRQIGLIVLLAQTGSFVPARQARIGIVDRIFTRVGASDNLASGESTFMVEMLEAANILNNATPQSLILLDEVGRGTSTFDGLSIAWAITEYLHHHKTVAAKTLFATHYHELTELAMLYPRICNYRVAVREYDNHVVFLRKIEPGGMDNSYGIYVAQMAGLPAAVVERAREVMANLEGNDISPHKASKLSRRRGGSRTDERQMDLFYRPGPSAIEKAVRQIDLNNLTPIEALLKIKALQEMLKKDED